MAEFEQVTEKGKNYVWIIDDNGYDSRFNPINYENVFKGTPLAGKFLKKKIELSKEIDEMDESKQEKRWKLFADAKLWKGAGGKYDHDQLQRLVMGAMLDFNARYDRKILSSKAK